MEELEQRFPGLETKEEKELTEKIEKIKKRIRHSVQHQHRRATACAQSQLAI